MNTRRCIFTTGEGIDCLMVQYISVCKLVIRECLCQAFIRIERGSEGDQSPQTQQGALFCMKPGEYQCFEVCWSETGSCGNKALYN